MGGNNSKRTSTDLPADGHKEKHAVINQHFDPVTNLKTYLQGTGPEEEFKAIELRDTLNGVLSNGKTDEAFKDKNKSKNRYAYVVPYDETRVKLKVAEDDSDYINASHVTGEEHSYICAQGPLPDTTEHFWKMVWDEKVAIILMLTKAFENGRVKCHRYYPETGEEDATFNHGSVRVEPVSVEENAETTVTTRTYKLTNLKDPSQPAREVVHYQYLGWPDHGVPENTKGIRDIIEKIDKIQESSEHQGPIIVHCSAGIGRTGTFCTVHIMLTRLRKYLRSNPGTPFKFNVYDTVLELRKQRTGMVQQPEQYRFCYEAIHDGAVELGVTFPEESEDDKKSKRVSKKKSEDDTSLNVTSSTSVNSMSSNKDSSSVATNEDSSNSPSSTPSKKDKKKKLKNEDKKKKKSSRRDLRSSSKGGSVDNQAD